jgi:hypothetical protein
MHDPTPIACSLGADDLRVRLEEISALGATSLTSHETTKEGHVLRFRNDKETHQRLKSIVAAEAKCCSFLEMAIEERNDDLLLVIDAPAEGRAVADGFASAFSATR